MSTSFGGWGQNVPTHVPTLPHSTILQVSKHLQWIHKCDPLVQTTPTDVVEDVWDGGAGWGTYTWGNVAMYVSHMSYIALLVYLGP